jgi:predicted transcriptional regulator
MKEIIKQLDALKKHEVDTKVKVEKIRKEIGLLIREMRIKKKVSLRTMAKKLGISAPYLSDIELGNRSFSEQFIVKIKSFGQLIEKDMKKIKS